MEKFLDQSLQDQLTKIFAELVHPVKVVYFSTSEKCDYCDQIEGLLSDVVSLSDKFDFANPRY